MKKIIAVCSLFTLFAVGANAQPGQWGDSATRAQRMKENHDRMKAGLMDQAKLTSDEADKVLEIQMPGGRGRMGGMRGGNADMNSDEGKKKMEEMKAEQEKKLKAIPLTDEKVKAVQKYFDEQMKARGMGGPGGGLRRMPAPGQNPQ